MIASAIKGSNLRFKQKGLSLLELLVVMLLTSLITTLMMQGFSFAVTIYNQVVVRKERTHVLVLSEQWFKGVNQNLVAMKVPGESLVGDETSFEATTLQPLIGLAGVPTEIKWKLISELDAVSLQYEELGQTYVVEKIRHLQPKFQYLASNETWLDSWPENSQEDSLPVAIRIFSGGADDKFNRTVFLQMRLVPDLAIDEVYK
jgi:general secretion pathway protein J